MTLIKTQPPVIVETKRDEYGIRVSVQHRRSRDKLEPAQYAVVLRVGAEYLETMAAQMRDEAALLVTEG